MKNKISKYTRATPDIDTILQVKNFIERIVEGIENEIWNEATEICDGFLTRAGQELDTEDEALQEKILNRTIELAKRFIRKQLKENL